MNLLEFGRLKPTLPQIFISSCTISKKNPIRDNVQILLFLDKLYTKKVVSNPIRDNVQIQAIHTENSGPIGFKPYKE